MTDDKTLPGDDLSTSFLNQAIDNEAVLKPPGPRHHIEVHYQVAPTNPASHRKLEVGYQHWRLILTPISVTGEPVALEIRGDTVIGSNRQSDAELDVNIAGWQGYELGVSRRHVMLRPSRYKLYVLDLRSTNGTHINGLPLGVGWAYALKDGDLLSLGRLNIRVRITQEPIPPRVS